MTLSVNEVEAFWIIVTFGGFLLTVFALGDAFRGFRAAQADTTASHEVRELTAFGNVRRESLRVLVQALLLSIAIPALFSDRPITLTPAIIALVLVPVVLFTATVFDTRDRGRLARLLVTMVREERNALALEASVQEVRQLVEKGTETTAAMFEVANHTNEKLIALTQIVGGKEDKP